MYRSILPLLCPSTVLKRFTRNSSKQKKCEWSEEAALFQKDIKALDPEVVRLSTGGIDRPPEEPLFLTFEDGFGYYTDAAVGRMLNQYQFIRKLGWAVSSTVWLALDKSKGNFVAIKLLTTQATTQIVAGTSLEYTAYQKITSTNPDSPGYYHCLYLRQLFVAKSAPGGHICFVTDVLSSSLARLRPPGQNRFALPIAKRIIKQVLLALDYLHRECGFIHTDVKSENILVEIPQPVTARIKEYVESTPSTVYGPPLNVKSLPVPIVFSCSQPLSYHDLGGSLEDISVRLVDYSEATPVDKPLRFETCQLSILRPPEVTLKYPWTSAIDIWTVGCLLFELLTEHQLFDQDSHNYSHEHHLRYIVEHLGDFPLEFLQNCEA